MRQTIGLNDFRRQWADTGAGVLEAVKDVGSSGWYILGQQVARFEAGLAAYWGFEQAVGVASGLDAIELSLRVLGCGPGDRVLTTPISAFATTLAILKLGAIPVFADCEDNGLVDLADCRRILEEHRNIRFFVPVHLYGHALDLDELARLRDAFGLSIVEDCAQSVGADSRGRPTGSAGAIAATSFYPTKNLGALGDGGAALTSSPEHAAALRRLRDYGQSAKYRHDAVGYNSRLDELQAAILAAVQLPRLPSWTARRREIARRYRESIDNPHIRIPREPEGSNSCYHLFPACVARESKSAAIAWFKSNGVQVGEHYPLAITDQPALEAARFCGDTPRARSFCASEISLPIHPYLEDDEVSFVIGACNAWKP